MNARFLLAPIFLILLLVACQPPEPEEEPPLSLAWAAVLVTPDRKLTVNAAADANAVYVFNEELPFEGDDYDYAKKWAALWRVDADGQVTGPVRFPDDAAAAELAAAGFGCPQPLGPVVAVAGDNVYVRVSLRNAAAQAAGCDTYDGSWNWKVWAVFGVFDPAGLQRTGLGWLKAFGDDDPTSANVYTRLAGGADGPRIGGVYRNASVGVNARFQGVLDATGTPTATLEGPADTGIRELFTMPEGWLASYFAKDPAAQGFGERLARFDGAGRLLWTADTVGDGPLPTRWAIGIPGQPDTVFVSGVVRDGQPFLGAAPPAAEPDIAVFVARVDAGALRWIRWVQSEEYRQGEWGFIPNHYAAAPLVYDPAYDELYVGVNGFLLALDPADGATRWVTNLREIVTGDPGGVDDWFFTYQPQNFTHLFLVQGRLVGVSYSWWDSNRGQGSGTDRYRPLVLGFERGY